MKERLNYWRHAVLHRVEPLILANGARFSGRMVHIAGVGCDFVDHTSDAIHTRRNTQRLRRDDHDELIISLVGRPLDASQPYGPAQPARRRSVHRRFQPAD
ncbi:hypothetical protein LGR54_07275 [Ancylobacter sp. Lp-2]|uniref:hypothetical protein n=1 Tax=Ancylobacter sp. Lp-2 TaxID=2881339 RepID=UPI001E32F250|nr:hypothetical protein [Ancylobacter sp. Lp-2]MCB4768401.1 hypothetical protein [Ancylobacter sp. Lp-2]